VPQRRGLEGPLQQGARQRLEKPLGQNIAACVVTPCSRSSSNSSRLFFASFVIVPAADAAYIEHKRICWPTGLRMMPPLQGWEISTGGTFTRKNGS
jgi:hypothetical protein